MRFLINVGITLLLLIPSNVWADFFDLQEVSLNYVRLGDGARWSPLNLINRSPISILDLNINTSVTKYGYWNNIIHTFSDGGGTNAPGQFRSVGWEYSFGVHLLSFFDIGIYHYSEHILDSPYPNGYNQMTGVQLKIYLYKKDKADNLF